MKEFITRSTYTIKNIKISQTNTGNGSTDGSVAKNLPAMQETQEIGVQSLGQEDRLEEAMATINRM